MLAELFSGRIDIQKATDDWRNECIKMKKNATHYNISIKCRWRCNDTRIICCLFVAWADDFVKQKYYKLWIKAVFVASLSGICFPLSFIGRTLTLYSEKKKRIK